VNLWAEYRKPGSTERTTEGEEFWCQEKIPTMNAAGARSPHLENQASRLQMNSNRRIEADRRQRRFATLAPSAHAER